MIFWQSWSMVQDPATSTHSAGSHWVVFINCTQSRLAYYTSPKQSVPRNDQRNDEWCWLKFPLLGNVTPPIPRRCVLRETTQRLCTCMTPDPCQNLRPPPSGLSGWVDGKPTSSKSTNFIEFNKLQQMQSIQQKSRNSRNFKANNQCQRTVQNQKKSMNVNEIYKA